MEINDYTPLNIYSPNPGKWKIHVDNKDPQGRELTDA